MASGRIIAMIPQFVKNWKNLSPQGAVRFLNPELETLTDEIESAVKDGINSRSGNLKDSIEVGIKASQDRRIEIEVKSDSEYFFQREKGGTLPRRKPGPMLLAPSFSPFAGAEDNSAALAEARGSSAWDKVFRPPGSSVILGERPDGTMDVLFILAKTVTQEGQNFAREGLNRMKPEIRRVARLALRRYVRMKS